MIFVRRWWPVAAFLLAALVVQKIVEARYDAKGHAAGHLAAAMFLFPAIAVVAIILWSTPGARRQPDVVLACGAWVAAVALVSVGNLRVVDAIGTNNWGDDEAGRFGTGLAGFESGHDLAQVASFAAVAAAVLLAVVVYLHHHVSRRVAIGAGIVSVLFPPWILPGAGVLVLAVALCLARHARYGGIEAKPY